jgi:2,5-diamino-6-(ribosylamino)-4(3H)-pyrimidinone 5'-phosphate reductase
MLSSVDGKIDPDSLRSVMNEDEYESTGEELGAEGWICGRTTMQRHFANKEPFASSTNEKAGPQPTFVARTAKSYAVSVDTLGKLTWSEGDLDGDHLICVVSEQAPEDYLTFLRHRDISYIVAGKESVDLVKTVGLLGENFGTRTLLLEGGGHINGAFLEADLVDELSLLIVPGIDGRHDIPAVFDGVSPNRTKAVLLKLKSVKQRKNDVLWIRYDVARPSE